MNRYTDLSVDYVATARHLSMFIRCLCALKNHFLSNYQPWSHFKLLLLCSVAHWPDLVRKNQTHAVDLNMNSLARLTFFLVCRMFP